MGVIAREGGGDQRQEHTRKESCDSLGEPPKIGVTESMATPGFLRLFSGFVSSMSRLKTIIRTWRLSPRRTVKEEEEEHQKKILVKPDSLCGLWPVSLDCGIQPPDHI